MNRGKTQAVIRGEIPWETGLRRKKGGDVKIFVDKPGRILYSPRFVYDGPTLRG